MNLLFLSTVYPDASQPARGSYNSALCRALAETHVMRVVSPRAWPESWRAWIRRQSWRAADADAAHEIVVNFPCLYYVPGWRRERLGEAMWRSTRSVIDSMHREQPIDAVLSYWVHPDGDAALRAAQRYGVPSTVIVGGSDVLLLPNEPKRGREIRRVLRETDAILTVSEGLRRAVIELGIDPSRVHTVYQGVDARVFHPDSQVTARESLKLPINAEVLLWVGRIVGVKRLDVLIDACRQLSAALPNVLLCLVGSGPLLNEHRRQVRDAGIEKHVRFVGNVEPSGLGDWYRAADLTVLSSDSEGLPNVLRESLACGTPYVTTDVGDIREVDGGRYGKFVAKGDSQQLSQAIMAALDERAGFSRVENQAIRTWRDMADEVASLLTSQHVSNAPHPGPLPHINASLEPSTLREGEGDKRSAALRARSKTTVR